MGTDSCYGAVCCLLRSTYFFYRIGWVHHCLEFVDVPSQLYLYYHRLECRKSYIYLSVRKPRSSWLLTLSSDYPEKKKRKKEGEQSIRASNNMGDAGAGCAMVMLTYMY